LRQVLVDAGFFVEVIEPSKSCLMDKWEKVVLFHRLLSRSKYSVPLKTILDELGCSEATFHRIRGFMRSSLGAPIVFNRNYGGYSYDKTDGQTFELPGFWLTKDEIEALLCLDNAVESMHEGFFSDLLDPVRKRFEPLLKAQRTTLNTLRERIKILSIGSRDCDREIFRTIAAAVVRRRRIAITHRPLEDDEPLKRVVSPQALVRYRDNWYVDAFCHLRKHLRTFALNRIESAGPAKGKFRKVPAGKMQAFYADSYGIFTGPADKKAVIDFTGTAAREVSNEQWHPKQKGEWFNDKTFRLAVPYGHSRELVMDILRWGEEAEVKGPEELRKTVKSKIKGMMKKYRK
jgi:predicted DNA-binding transcriptional regulator YafY